MSIVPSKLSIIYIDGLYEISSTSRIFSLSHVLEHHFKYEGFCDQNSGQMVPLDELVRLKEEYKFRILVDESNSLGVVGRTGRGISEHYNVPVYFCLNWKFLLHIEGLPW